MHNVKFVLIGIVAVSAAVFVVYPLVAKDTSFGWGSLALSEKGSNSTSQPLIGGLKQDSTTSGSDSEYTVNDTPKAPYVPVPTKEIVNTVLVKTSLIDFEKWNYGNTLVMVEFITDGTSQSMNSGKYDITCEVTRKDPTVGGSAPLGKGWINSDGHTKITKATVRTVYLPMFEDPTPCNNLHIKVEFQSYYKGDIGVRATLMQ
jgi:hypothetical protein